MPPILDEEHMFANEDLNNNSVSSWIYRSKPTSASYIKTEGKEDYFIPTCNPQTKNQHDSSLTHLEYLSDCGRQNIWFPISCDAVIKPYYGKAVLVHLR
jgi:hypothetical protein